MELRHIHYFLTLAEEKSFTKAAEKLLIAQPPLSRQIKDLEEELGAELFTRTKRGVVLTESGEKFRQYALQIDHLANQSKEMIRELNTGLQGTLYIASIEGQAPRFIAEWIAGFHKLYPHVEFNVWNGNSDNVQYRLQNGLCDLGMMMSPIDEEHLDGLFVFEEPWVAMIPATHPLAENHSSEIALEELAPYELMIPSRQSRLQEITGWFAENSVKPKVCCRIAHVLNAIELTEQNVGIAIYPAAASLYADPAKVVVKKLINPNVTASYYFTKGKAKELSHVALEFWNYVESLLTYSKID